MRSLERVVFAVLSLGIVSALLCAPVLAQGPADYSASNGPANVSVEQSPTAGVPDTPQQTSAAADDSWHFDLSPYVWFPGIHGTVGALGHEASVHLSGGDVISDFQGGIAGLFEIRKGRIVIPLDFIYAKTATTQGIPLNDLGQSQVRAGTSQGIFNPKIGYRFVDGEHFKVDALFGLRVWHEGLSLTLRPSQRNFSDSTGWVDAVAGGRFLYYFTPKVWITAEGDAGGGAANVDYQALGIINFQPKPLFGFLLGWRYLDVDYANINRAFVFDLAQTGPIIGLNMQFGGKPPVPPAASCSASPTEVWAGEPVTANISTQNFNPKHTLTYNWASSGVKISGTGTTANVDTTGLAPGSYSITGTATDPKEKKNNVASCNTSFTVKTPHPPTASCSASPDSVKAGDPATVTASASSPDNFPLTYAWTTSAGSITPNGSSATLNTTNAPQGSPITATATVTDSRGLSTTCTANVNVLAPPPPVVNEVTQIGECQFMDKKRPARVDNTCKAVLDDVALRIQHEPSGKFVIVGYSEDEETAKGEQLAAQRAVNVKYYLVNGEGGSQIDATRLDVRTSETVKEKGAKIYFVPSGATFSEETVPVDETQVKGQARNAPALRKKSKKAATQAPPNQ